MIASAFIGAVLGPTIQRIVLTKFSDAARQEQAKDALLEEIVSHIDDLLRNCEEFWGKPAQELSPRRRILAARIQAQLHTLNMLQNELFLGHQQALKNCRNEWTALHRAATGGQFDDDDRPDDPDLLLVIFKDGWDYRRSVVRRRAIMPRHWLSG